MSLPLTKSLAELPEYRFVLVNLVARDLKVRYQDKSLGFIWSVLHPALLLGIWYLVFRHVVRVEVGGPRYWAFLIPGMLTYQFIQTSIVEGARAVRDNAGIVRKVYVPMEVLVCAAVSVRLIEYLIQLVVAMALLAALHYGGGGGDAGAGVAEFSFLKTLSVLPGAVILIYLFVLGVAMPLSGFTILYRDLDHLVGLALTAMLYLSPIFWSLAMIADRSWVTAFAFNPVADLIILVRDPMYWGTWPTNPAVGGGPAAAWGVAAGASTITFVAGYALLARVKHTLAEVV